MTTLRKWRWRRIIVRGGLVALAVLIVGGWVVFEKYGWTSPPIYAPAAIEFGAPMRTSGEHDEFMRDREWPYVFEVDPEGDGALYYFGSYHTKDPDDPEIGMIREAFAAFDPTVAVCESRMGFLIGGIDTGIRWFSEPGLVYGLAREKGIGVYSLETAFEDEAEHLRERFGDRATLMYYTLSIYLSERDNGMNEAGDDAAALRLMRKRAKQTGTGGAFEDIAALDAYWDETFDGSLGDWRVLDAREMWPGNEERSLLTRLANASNGFRDAHQARVIIDLVRKGERVFAVCGGSHAVKQEPAIRATLVVD